MSMVRSAFPYFTSRFASTFYQALNVIIIGKIYGTAPEVGYYTSSDKCLSLVKMGSSPIADSLYPYMLNHKNYRLIKKASWVCDANYYGWCNYYRNLR